MGTNFYARRIPTKERTKKMTDIIQLKFPEKKSLCEMIDNGDAREISHMLEDLMYEFDKARKECEDEVHLGKRSYGWQFLWQYYDGKFYSDNKKSIEEFLNSGEYEIFNEYGEKFTSDQFWNEEVNGILYKTDKLWDLEAYWKENPPESFMLSHLNDEWTSEDGLRFCKNDFS